MPHSDTIVVNEQALEQMRQSGDYDYTRELVEESEKLMDQEMPSMSGMSDGLHIPGWVWITIGVVILLLLLFLFYRSGGFRKLWDFITFWRKNKKSDDDGDEEEDEVPEEEKATNADTDIRTLKPEEITDGIVEAMAAGDYRQAVRLIYLTTLRELHERGAVQWRHDKTPEDYAREAGLPSFTRLTMHFMMVRYGDYEATRKICETMLAFKAETLPAVTTETRKEGEA